MSRTGLLWATALVAAASGAAGCRGATSAEPPMHWRNMGFIAVTNMNIQQKAKTQLENGFFADKRTMRPQVPGTEPRLVEGAIPAGVSEEVFTTGAEGGAQVKHSPVPLSRDVLARGQERFDIYCAPCHDRTGAGNGIVVQRAAGAIVKPPAYTSDTLKDKPDGYFFDVISHGVRTMPSYAYQVPVADRWAIVAYLRALQRSQNAKIDDVPAEMRSNLK